MNSAENDDLLEQLRTANPFVDEGTTPNTTMRKSARFEEITMQTQVPTTAPRRTTTTNTSWWRQPRLATPLAVFAVLALLGGGLLFNVATAPSALALVNDAAQTSAGFDSGRVEIQIELRELPDQESGSVSIDHRYEGGNYSTAFVSTLESYASGGLEQVVIKVDDVLYSQIGNDAEFTQTTISDEQGPFAESSTFGIDPETITPESVIPLIEQSSDFAEVESNGDATVLRGSVPVSVLQDLDVSDLPPGLGLFTGENAEDLPDTLGITATVADDRLLSIAIDVIGDTSVGFTDATVTTVFSEFGEPQMIEGPDGSAVSDEPVSDVAAELQEALGAIDEVESRRPGLCAEVWAENAGSEDIELLAKAFDSCLRDAGEVEAADAFAAVATRAAQG